MRVRLNNLGGERIVEGTDLLVATGRTANTDGMGLDIVGVQLNERGYIKVNDRLETSASKVGNKRLRWQPAITHVAFDDFRVVHINLGGGNRTTSNRRIPFCMFSDPELARVGRNEREAQHEKLDYRVTMLPMSKVLRTRPVSETRGFMKILVARDSDEILGFTAFGFDASEPMAVVQTGDARPFAIYEFARRDFHPSNDVGRSDRAAWKYRAAPVTPGEPLHKFICHPERAGLRAKSKDLREAILIKTTCAELPYTTSPRSRND